MYTYIYIYNINFFSSSYFDASLEEYEMAQKEDELVFFHD